MLTSKSAALVPPYHINISSFSTFNPKAPSTHFATPTNNITTMETEVATAPSPPPLFKKRAPKSSQIRKRPVTPPLADSDSESGYTSTSSAGGGHRIKRRKASALVTATSKDNSTIPPPADLSATHHSADHTTALATTNDATKSTTWYESAPSTTKKPTQPSNTTTAATNGTLKPVGPVKSASNVRTTTYTDFAPDVCKDYKQTGYCGFGDNCKYLHERSDYKAGWELDKEWEKVGGQKKAIDGRREKGLGKAWKPVGGLGMGKGKSAGTAGGFRSGNGEGEMDEVEEERLLEGIPFVCLICREGYKMPVVTKCGHYFCEACALKRYKKNPACATCAAGTGGVFNGAKGLQRLLERKRERGRRRREKVKAEGGEVSEAEEGEEVEGGGKG